MKPIYLFALLLFSFSLVSATDCWQLTHENNISKCVYVDAENCTDYDNFYDCERERLKPENIIQSLIESIAPNYESEYLNKLYTLSNTQILFFCLFVFLLWWMLNNAK